LNKLFLLADDDLDDAELFSEALNRVDSSITLHHVDNGTGVFEFLGQTNSQKPDLIFLDLNMPKMSGWQCLAQLKNNVVYKDIPVIMYTTSSHYRDTEIALDLGAHGLVTKPSEFKVLKTIIASIINNMHDDLSATLKELQGLAKY
jgi:CheY-like chemotaxis protein